MAETRDLSSILNSAQHAAETGDYAAAEAFLREAATLQETQLGPLHPDLANTLNNLAVVCEVLDKPADAERCYRRAYAIATSALEPDHPFVATSRKNLADFCEARGVPFETAPVQSPEPAERTSDTSEPPERNGDDAVANEPPEQSGEDAKSISPPAESRENAEPRAVTTSSSSRPAVIAAVAVGAVIIAVFLATRPWSSSDSSSPGAKTPSETATSEPAPAFKVPTPAPKEPTPKKGGQPAPAVGDARLCRTLATDGAWRCDRPDTPVSPGPLVFYTRVKSARDTTVQHRWYQGDVLRKTATLSIRASPTEGYRTYSRYTIEKPGAGNWRVELRAKDDALLHEERFVVR